MLGDQRPPGAFYPYNPVGTSTARSSSLAPTTGTGTGTYTTDHLAPLEVEASFLGKTQFDALPEDAPNTGLDWASTTMLILADLVGIGVLTMGRIFAQLGWILAVLLLTALSPVNVYMGVLVARAKGMFPEVRNYRELAEVSVGSFWVSVFVHLTFLSYVLFTMSGFFLAIVDALEMVFFEVAMCGLQWSVVAALALFLPAQIRSLKETKVLLWLNFACICFAILIGLAYMIQHIDTHHGAFSTYLVHPQLTFVEFWNAMAKVTFSYFGCYIYLEMMAEMKDYREFPKSLFVAAPFQYVLYLAVGIVGFLYDGAQAKDIIIAEINPKESGVTFRLASLALLFHLLVAFIIKTTVFTRVVYRLLTPSLKLHHATAFKRRLAWLGISACVLLTTFTLANAVPLFGKMTSLLGALQVPILGYIMPVIFFLCARNRLGLETSRSWKAAFSMIIVFAISLLLVGTASNIQSFQHALRQANLTLFECQPTPIVAQYER